MGMLFLIRVIYQLRVEITKDCCPLVALRVVGIVDVQILDHDALGHIGGIAKIMLSKIGSSKKDRFGSSATGRDEHTIAYDEGTFPCAAIVWPQIDEVPSVHGAVLDQKCTRSNGVYSHVSELRIADGSVGYTHMRVKP